MRKILGIVGSLRKAFYNHAALKAAQELLPAGVVLDKFVVLVWATAQIRPPCEHTM